MQLTKEYAKKTTESLNTPTFQKRNIDPTEKYQKKIKRALDNAPSIISVKDKYKLTAMNPQAPKLYFLIKLHKDSFPISPVVSFVTAPSKNFSKRLIDLLIDYC